MLVYVYLLGLGQLQNIELTIGYRPIETCLVLKAQYAWACSLKNLIAKDGKIFGKIFNLL